MKKFLLLSTIFVASTALAFGGIGIGSKSSSHKAGVDAIGIHIDPNGKKADIDIVDGDSQEEEITSCPEGKTLHTTDVGNVCCQEGAHPLCMYLDDSGKCAMYTCSFNETFSCTEGEKIYCVFPSCSGPGPQCCSTDKQLTCLRKEYGICNSSICCASNEKAYDMYINNPNTVNPACCAGQVYCSKKDAQGNCIGQACCTSQVFENAGKNQADLCCGNGDVPTCAQDTTGACADYACCPEGQTARIGGPFGYLCCDGDNCVVH